VRNARSGNERKSRPILTAPFGDTLCEKGGEYEAEAKNTEAAEKDPLRPWHFTHWTIKINTHSNPQVRHLTMNLVWRVFEKVQGKTEKKNKKYVKAKNT
jgi:hypothetical protein